MTLTNLRYAPRIFDDKLFYERIFMKKKFLLRKIILFLIICFGSPIFSHAKSISIKPVLSIAKKEKQEPQKLSVKKIDRMFWELTGTDLTGKPSTVYLLGTIHVGDDRLYPLPEKIQTAFDSADRLAAEIGSEDMAALQKKLLKIMLESYKNSVGKNFLDELTDEEKEILYNALDKKTVDRFARFEPWLITTTLSSLEYGNAGLDSSRGIDSVLMDKAKSAGRTWDGLDDLQVQIDILKYGTYEQQIFVLKDLLNEIKNDEAVSVQTQLMYEAYLADDVDFIGEISQDNTEEYSDPEIKEFVIEYNKKLIDDRNSVWAKKIVKYIEQGGTTFIFAGCAHFTSGNTVFYFLQQNGNME